MTTCSPNGAVHFPRMLRDVCVVSLDRGRVKPRSEGGKAIKTTEHISKRFGTTGRGSQGTVGRQHGSLRALRQPATCARTEPMAACSHAARLGRPPLLQIPISYVVIRRGAELINSTLLPKTVPPVDQGTGHAPSRGSTYSSTSSFSSAPEIINHYRSNYNGRGYHTRGYYISDHSNMIDMNIIFNSDSATSPSACHLDYLFQRH